MNSVVVPILLLSLAPLTGTKLVTDAHVPPAVGAVAKPLESVHWYYEGASGKVPSIADLRGDVVLVHTWGYYCGPCIRLGVPYVVDLMKAHGDHGLRTFSLSCQVGDDKPAEHFVTVGREMGMDHPLGLTDAYGEMSPYLNMNESSGLTWCFVIGREGGLHWAGDPSIDEKEFLEAVRSALSEEAAPPLAEDIPEPLNDAVALYIEGQLARARAAAAKVRKSHAKKRRSATATAVVASATELIAELDAYLEELSVRVARALEARDAEDYLAARELILTRFAKTDAAKEIKALDRAAGKDDAFSDELDGWTRWNELHAAAPVLFTVRVDKGTKRYAKKLSRYVKRAEPGAPGLAEAREMLKQFAAAGQ